LHGRRITRMVEETTDITLFVRTSGEEMAG